ncbi:MULTISPECIES: HU family DNA-binding protein [unclassified Bacteroides]|jgi:predicted histone-like DNA-binding protein|uniref:HU family DNA-binding protein n=1 Tax=unclassified Bacteroides TaxID=2646097 RepID=UPI001F427736|nr:MULTISPECIES: HU family DNA-binding protein [unclassified Bacteroides]
MQQYVVIARKNPLKMDESPRYYAQARSAKKVDTEKICQRISERSSYSPGELEGTIAEFLLELKNVLEEGNTAQVGKLGSFRLSVRTGQPTDTVKDFKNTNVGRCRVIFSPGTHLVSMCKTMKYTPYKSEAEKEEEVVKPS